MTGIRAAVYAFFIHRAGDGGGAARLFVDRGGAADARSAAVPREVNETLRPKGV
jgi:hypothetical protein